MAKRSRDAIKEAAEHATRAFEAAAKAGGTAKTFGDIVFWDFSPGWGIRSADARDAWIAQGLNPDSDLPVPPDMETAFTRAVEHVRGGLAARSKCKLIALPTQDGSKRFAVMLVEANGTAKGTTRGIVQLPKDGTAFVEQADPWGCAAAIVSSCAHYLDRYVSDDIRMAVTVVLDRWAATPCRQCPPHIVYYLPSVGFDTIRRVRDAVAKMGAGSVHLCPLGVDADSRESATAAANGGLEAQLTAFAKEADEWATKPPSRTSTIENRIAEAERLRTTGMLYRSILGSAVESVDAKISKVQQQMRVVLGLVEDAKEARA